MFNPQNFPVEVLPPLMQNAVREVHGNIGAPLPVIVSSMIGATSLVCQDKINVRKMEGLESPCSLFLLSIAESGERKTACDKHFLKPIRDFEEAQAISGIQHLKRSMSQKAAWEAERSGILLAIKNQGRDGQSTEDLQQSLVEIESKEPIEPKIPKLIFNNATPASILYGLFKRWSSAGIMSDEGAVIFDSRAMHNLGELNKLWDGDALHVDRISTECFVLTGARLTISLMVQPKTFEKFLKKQGSLSRDNGFLARFLVSYPLSTQGSRFIENANPTWQNVHLFQNRLSEILNSDLSEPGKNSPARNTLSFSPEAQVRWIDFHNRVEYDLRNGHLLSDIRDNAAKIADNMARMAALFHYFQGGEGDIGIESVESAAAICSWYLCEFKKMFGVQPDVPIEMQDAKVLEIWLANFCKRYPGISEFPLNVILQLGPHQLRKNKIRREAALFILVTHGKVQILRPGKTKILALNPAFFATQTYYQVPQISQPMQYLPQV